MKKLFIVLSLFMLSFVFISCDRNNTTATTTEPAQSTTVEQTTQPQTTQPQTTQPVIEQIAAPTNLRLVDKMLMWDAVPNAQGYIVYIDGAQAAMVNETSYDFTDNMSESILFQVVTKAPTGHMNSEMSASLAYNWDRAAEILAVRNVLNTYPFTEGLPVEFAEELVDKGMTSQDTQLMISGVAVFQTTMETVSTPQEGLLAVNGLLANFDNTEALVSAMVKVVLVDMIESEIDYLDDMIDMYGYQSDIQQRAYLLALLLEIETNPDVFILGIVNTIDHIISIEQMVTVDFLTSIEELANGTTQPSGAEIVAILDEVAYMLNQTMPTEEEVMSLVVLANTIQSVFGVPEINVVTDMDEKTVDIVLYTGQLIVDFIDIIEIADVDFILGELENYDSFTEVEIIIHVAKILDRYIEQEEVLINNLRSVYSDADKVALFDAVVAEILNDWPEGGPEGLDTFIGNLDFATILALQVTMEEGFEAVFDLFIETDGEILRQLVILDGYYYMSDLSGSTYMNDVLDETYADYDEYSIARYETRVYVAQSGFNLYNAFIQNIDATEMDVVNEFVLEDVLSNIINSLDFEAMVTPPQEYEGFYYNYMHNSIETNDFEAPITLGPGEYFSSRWGIAIRSYYTEYDNMFEVTYIDPVSPLLDLHYGMGQTYSLQVGDLISYIQMYNSFGNSMYTYGYYHPSSAINNLNNAVQIGSLCVKVPGPEPQPMLSTLEANALLGLLIDFVDVTSEDGLTFLQNLCNYVVTEELIYNSLSVYEEGIINENYYAEDVYILQHFNAFMTYENRVLLDGILDEVYLTLKSVLLDDYVPLTDMEIDTLDVAINNLIDGLETQSALVFGMDHTNLTPLDIAALDAIRIAIEGYVDAIFNIIEPPMPA